jgi:hypothetical protein
MITDINPSGIPDADSTHKSTKCPKCGASHDLELDYGQREIAERLGIVAENILCESCSDQSARDEAQQRRVAMGKARFKYVLESVGVPAPIRSAGTTKKRTDMTTHATTTKNTWTISPKTRRQCSQMRLRTFWTDRPLPVGGKRFRRNTTKHNANQMKPKNHIVSGFRITLNIEPK